MYIQLIRNKPQGNAITGRLVINGHWFCYTLERVGYQIPALCYHVAVTMSPKFKRLLPLVQNVPASPKSSPKGKDFNSDEKLPSLQGGVGGRQGIRFHRGTRPEHSTGCILVVADNPSSSREFLSRRWLERSLSTIRAEVVENNVVEVVDSNNPIVGCRSAADVEKQLTDLILKAQNEHEEIILEVIDFTPGTQYGYDHPCVRELQQHEIDARRAEQRYYELHPEECKG